MCVFCDSALFKFLNNLKSALAFGLCALKKLAAATNWSEAARANRRLRGWEEKRVCCSPGVLRVQRGLLRSSSRDRGDS